MLRLQSRWVYPATELPEEKMYRTLPVTIVATVVMIILSLLTIGLTKQVKPEALPLSWLFAWNIQGNVWDWCRSAWPLLVWAATATGLVCFTRSNNWRYNQEAERHYTNGLLISLWAGVSEEVLYRWVYFLASIVWIQLINVVLLGLPQWLHLNLLGPLADVVSFQQLHSMMFHPAGWFIGAGMLSANAAFRDGHAYQGPVGMVNSWFIGLFMFWMVFHYGLLAAITIHVLYDCLIFTIRYLDAVHERRNGNG